MRRKVTLAGLAAAVLLAAALVAGLLRERGEVVARPEVAPGGEIVLDPAETEKSGAAGAEASRTTLTPPAPVPGPADDAPFELVVYPAERSLAELVIEVVDDDEHPVEGAALQLASDIGAFPPGLEIADDRGIELRNETDEHGRASFGALPVGPYTVVAAAAVLRVRTSFTLVDPPDATVRVVLEPPRESTELVVRVEDERGATVPGAEVEVFAKVPGVGLAGANGLPLLRAVTGDHGLAAFPDTDVGAALVQATAPDGRKGLETSWTKRRELKAFGVLPVTVVSPGVLEGELIGLSPEHLAESRVLAHALIGHGPFYWTHGASEARRVLDGRFRFDGLPPGRYSMTIEDPAGARLVLPTFDGWGRALENSVTPATVEVRSDVTTVFDLEVTMGAWLEGRVTTVGGRAVAGARVWSTYAPISASFPAGFLLHGVNVWRLDSDSRLHGLHPEVWRTTSTHATGRYVFAGLHPGRHRIEVFAPGLTCDRREGVQVTDGETTALEHVLQPAGVIQGIDRRGGYLGLSRPGEEGPRFLAIIRRDGQFTFPGLEPGAWEVARFHSDPARGKVPLTTVEVEAGRTTWVDLRDIERPVRIEGRVLDAAGPVAGAHVKDLVTDERGRFAMTVDWPYTEGVRLDVDSLDGVTTYFAYPGMDPDDTLWSEDLVLGSESLVVRTLDADGHPAPAEIDVELVEGYEEPYRSQRARVSSRGFVDVAIHRLFPATYEVRAAFDDGSEDLSTVTLPRREPLVLKAPTAGVVLVHVRTSDGRPLPEAEVRITTWLGTGPAPADFEQVEIAETEDPWQLFVESWGYTDAAGEVTFTGIAAGEIQIDAWPPTGWKRRRTAQRNHLSRGETLELYFDLTLD